MSSTVPTRPELPVPPARIARLPVDHRGYPVPFFVAWVEGQPDHRIVDPRKVEACYQGSLCWICGQRLGSYLTFTIGPMCAVNRVSSELPSHLDCAEYAAKACPFLTRPGMRRREAGRPEGVKPPAGMGHPRNPGVVLLWTTRSFTVITAPNGQLFGIGDPVGLQLVSEGRPATQEELIEAFESGVEILLEAAVQGGPAEVRELQQKAATARELLRIPPPHPMISQLEITTPVDVT